MAIDGIFSRRAAPRRRPGSNRPGRAGAIGSILLIGFLALLASLAIGLNIPVVAVGLVLAPALVVGYALLGAAWLIWKAKHAARIGMPRSSTAL